MARPNSHSVTPSVRVLAFAAVGSAAVALSGCGATSNFAPREGYAPPAQREVPRPNFPIAPPGPDLTGQTVAPLPDAQAPQVTATPDGPPPTTAPRGAVSSQALPPLAAPPAPLDIPPPPPPPPPAAAYVPPPPRMVATTTTVTTVAGRVVDTGGKPVSYTVKSGDTLTAIARKLDTTQKQLADDNDLEPPYALRPGKTLKGPNTRAKAYVVGQGDTLSAIARRFSVTPAALAAANDMRVGGAIRSGQRLELPTGYRDTGPVRTQVTTTAPAPATAAAAPQPPSGPPPSYAAAPASAPPVAQSVATTTTVTSVSGRVVDVPGKPVSYKVKKGDTLIGIADRLNTTTSDLAEDNGLKKPYRIRPGQTLKGPATRGSKAYVVGQGDTLYAIAQRFGVSASSLAAANGMRVGAALRSGQRLELPKGYRDTGPVRTMVATTTTALTTTLASATPPAAYTPPPYTPPAATAYVPPPARPSATTTTTTTTTAPVRPGGPAVTTTTTTIRPATPPATASALPEPTVLLSDADIAAAGRGRFAWPVRGSVLSAYGPKGTGQRNDGLDVSAPSGEPVRAAAAGEVVYAGDQVPGFGNLVLVKHDGGWVTAYAHLARSDVRMRQTVAQGQQIGAVGQTGGVAEPQLHFEVRYAPTAKDKAKPIDPSLVLPK